ncbi:MAG TPA: hypothetical protein DDW76_22210 [Cyanobacteria bacterium UBA11369]|nr:hypothetical protein [Cyanobacteria bacterium UBA11371]HBE30785.1 hypothetical protein [Cyanobacteria bacterium UBA11368]HBE51413.1 hypothetical protein [Cyanobacteria bacterium UBA11369]
MIGKLFQNLLKRKVTGGRKRKIRGFTLIELLISILIAGLIVTALLDLVIDLLQTDRREYARTETQREMQLATDFIVNDVREAVYIYSNEELNDDRPNQPGRLRNYLPDFGNGVEPVLAFWKTDPFPYREDQQLPNCGPRPQADPVPADWARCNSLRVRRRTFTLVVYLLAQNTRDDSARGWKGVSRIMRYELRQYNAGTGTTAEINTQNQGYAEPLANNVTFASWPYNSNGQNMQSSRPAYDRNDPNSRPPVLVDFVDFATMSRRTDNHQDGLTPPADPRLQCPTGYSAIPPQGNPSNFDNPSFAACVSSGTTARSSTAAAAAAGSSTNQDAIIFLRGNPTGKAGVKVAPLIAIRTQAVARGVVDKTPTDQ